MKLELEKIIDTDKFLEMSLSTQCLYIHLSIRADKFGIVENYRTLMRMIGISESELELLILKGYAKIKDNKVYLMNGVSNNERQ